MLTLGFRVIAVCAESGPIAREVAQANFPDAIHVEKVEHLNAAALAPFLRRREVSAIFCGGGSPCQGNTSLNSQRRGLEDARTQQAELAARLAEDIQRTTPVPVVAFLENVASAPKEVIKWYSSLFGATPVRTQAAEFGWVTRSRLWWIKGPDGHPCSIEDIHLPEDLELVPQGPGKLWADLRYKGKKPIPAVVNIEDGFAAAFSPQDVVSDSGGRAMFPFTREFAHPSDHVKDASPAAATSFVED